MLELILCSMVTILPDYLFRRYAQGKRFGHEITLYSVWFELRWGIIACLVLTVRLITMFFYYHPSTKSAVSFFRTVPLLPEASGRVEEIYVGQRDKVKAGQPIFKLDSSKQEAALETARRRIAEVDAAMEQAKVELESADGKIQEAQGAYQQLSQSQDTTVANCAPKFSSSSPTLLSSGFCSRFPITKMADECDEFSLAFFMRITPSRTRG
jgi:multidrug resistance efflux pump